MGLLQKSGKHEWVRKGHFAEKVIPMIMIIIIIIIPIIIIMQVGLILDFLWSGMVIAPLVVLYWRGTWDLLEDFVCFRLSLYLFTVVKLEVVQRRVFLPCFLSV